MRRIVFIVVLLLMGFFLFSQEKVRPKKATIKFKILFDRFNKGDTCVMRVWGNIFSDPETSPSKVINSIVDENGCTKIQVFNINSPVYVSLSNARSTATGLLVPFLKCYIAEPGDDIVVNVGKIVPSKLYHNYRDSIISETTVRNISFSGINFLKYKCQRELWQMMYDSKDSLIKLRGAQYLPQQDSTSYRKYYLDEPRQLRFSLYKIASPLDSILRQVLIKYKGRIPDKIYSIIELNLKGEIGNLSFDAFRSSYVGLGKRYVSKVFADSLKNVLSSEYESYSNKRGLRINLPASWVAFSFVYINHLINIKLSQAKFQYDSTFKLLLSLDSNSVREKLLTAFLSNSYNFIRLSDANMSVSQAYHIIKSEDNLRQIDKIMSTQSKGRKAYNFMLPNNKGQIVSLSEFTGKVVFVDFWFTGCIGCTQYYLSNVSKAEKYYSNNPNVVFISISCDINKTTWLKSIKTGLYTNEEMVNLYTNGKGFQHPVTQKFMVTGSPRPILIGKDGRIFSNSAEELRDNAGGRALILTISKALSSNE